jgi:hypothetical protein
MRVSLVAIPQHRPIMTNHEADHSTKDRMRIVHAAPVTGAMNRKPVQISVVQNAAARLIPADEGTIIRTTPIVQNAAVRPIPTDVVTVNFPLIDRLGCASDVTAPNQCADHLRSDGDLPHKVTNAADEDVTTNEYSFIG